LEPARGHTETTNRDLLMEVCRDWGLCVANAWFRKADGKQVTYMAPGVGRLPLAGPCPPGQVAELDLCLANLRWKGAVKDVRSRPFAGLPYDHVLLEVGVQLRLKARGRGMGGGD